MTRSETGFSPESVEKQVGEEAKDSLITDMGGLESLLEKAGDALETATISSAQLEEYIAKREVALAELKRAYDERGAELTHATETHAIPDFKASDYDRLVQGKIITAREAEVLKKLDTMIQKARAQLKSPVVSAEESARVTAAIRPVEEKRREIREDLEARVERLRGEARERQREEVEAIVARYDSLLASIEGKIREIEGRFKYTDPEGKEGNRLIEALHEMAEKIHRERNQTQQEALKRLEGRVQGLNERHGYYFDRMNALVGKSDVRERTNAAMERMKRGDRKGAFAILNGIRDELALAMLDVPDATRPESADALTPFDRKWKERGQPKWKVPYDVEYGELRKKGDTIGQLPKGEREDALRLQALRLSAERESFTILVGNTKKIKDSKTGKERYENRLRDAFATRKENDESGETKKRQAERDRREKEEAAYRERIEAIVKAGGFVIEVPVYRKDLKGNPREVGRGKGAVRVEKVKLEKKKETDPDKEMWRIVEFVGPEGGATLSVQKGHNQHQLDFGSTPSWFRDQLNPHFVRHGKEYTELYVAGDESGPVNPVTSRP